MANNLTLSGRFGNDVIINKSLTVNNTLAVTKNIVNGTSNTIDSNSSNNLISGDHNKVEASSNSAVIGHDNTLSVNSDDSIAIGVNNNINASNAIAVGKNVAVNQEDTNSFTWNSSDSTYTSNGEGTFNINPHGGANGIYIGNDTLTSVMAAQAVTSIQDAELLQLLQLKNVTIGTSDEGNTEGNTEGNGAIFNVNIRVNQNLTTGNKSTITLNGTATYTGVNKSTSENKDSTEIANVGFVSQKISNLDNEQRTNNIVHKKGDETISGNKTFTDTVLIYCGKSSADVTTDAKDNEYVTAKWVNNDKINNNIVHKTGDETIGGTKIFNGAVRLKNDNVTVGTTPTESKETFLFFTDRKSKPSGYISNLYATDGARYVRMGVCDNNGDGQEGIVLAHTVDNKIHVSVPQPIDITSTTSNQIATVGWVNNDKLTTNIVHKTGEETINDEKTFTSYLYSKNSQKVGDILTSDSYQGVLFTDSDNKIIGGCTSGIYPRLDSSGTAVVATRHSSALTIYDDNGTRINSIALQYDSTLPTTRKYYAHAPIPIGISEDEIATTGWVKGAHCDVLYERIINESNTDYKNTITLNHPWSDYSFLRFFGYYPSGSGSNAVATRTVTTTIDVPSFTYMMSHERIKTLLILVSHYDGNPHGSVIYSLTGDGGSNHSTDTMFKMHSGSSLRVLRIDGIK